MSDIVKLYAFRGSPYSCRPEIALKLKGVKYEFGDAYEKAQARFWARFVDDKVMVHFV
ncbi:putative glutathione S-transferase, Thioredoxin-like superfamily [Helianthus anomalus]